MQRIALEFSLLILLLLANGVLAMAEMALVSARKSRLLARAEEGDAAARIALTLAEQPTRLLSTVQIGITLVGILAGAFGGATLAESLTPLIAALPFIGASAEAISIGLVVLVTTYLSLVIGELAPKRVALNNPEGIAVAVAPLMQFLSAITGPVVNVLSVSTNAVLRLLQVEAARGNDISEDDVRALLLEATRSGAIEAAEQDIMEAVFHLDDRPIAQLMTPRPRVVFLDVDEPLERNIDRMIASAHSTFPVYRDKPDNVIGVVNVKRLFAQQVRRERFDFEAALEQPLVVPESATAIRVLEEFRIAGRHLALVVDEYGSPQGVVTLHDIIELVLGDLPDTHHESPEIVTRADGSLLVDALLPLVELEEYLECDPFPQIEEGDYNTVAGYLLASLERIPREGDQIEAGGFTLEVVDMDGPRIDKVLVLRQDESSQTGD